MALNPFLSTGLRKSMLDGNAGIVGLFDGGELHIYSGTQPANADTTEGAGTVLAKALLPDGTTTQVQNGAFTTDTLWTKGTGWTVDAGDTNVATCDGTQAGDTDLTQVDGDLVASLIQNVEYEVTFTISGYTAGNVVPVVGNTEGTDRSANGTFTETIVAGAGTDFDMRGDVNFDGDIDDVSIVIHGFQLAAVLASIAKNGAWADASADATGTAAWFRLYDSAVTLGASTTAIRVDGSVGVGATFDIDISNTGIIITDTVSIDTFTIDLLASDSV